MSLLEGHYPIAKVTDVEVSAFSECFLFFKNFREREAKNAHERSEQDASVLVRLIVSKFHKKSFSAIILFFRNCVRCERLTTAGRCCI